MISLAVRKTIRATPERLFAAWTTPDQLMRWWGPHGVECIEAQVDLRVGGRYRLANRFPEGRVVWIVGEFERIERPTLLVYTWQTDADAQPERVTVRFDATDHGTDVSVVHERIPHASARDQHRRGWEECLAALDALVGRSFGRDGRI